MAVLVISIFFFFLEFTGPFGDFSPQTLFFALVKRISPGERVLFFWFGSFPSGFDLLVFSPSLQNFFTRPKFSWCVLCPCTPPPRLLFLLFSGWHFLSCKNVARAVSLFPNPHKGFPLPHKVTQTHLLLFMGALLNNSPSSYNHKLTPPWSSFEMSSN